MANDSCAAPAALAIGTPLSGDITNAHTDFSLNPSGTCAVNNALGGIENDEVFSFTAPAAGAYQFDLWATTPALNAVLIALDTCSPGTINTCMAGANTGTNGATETVRLNLTQGQSIFLVAGATSCSALGPFTLTATVMPTAPVQWTCDPTTYGDGLCDCGCGVVDWDCSSGMELSCDRCTPCNPTDPQNCSAVVPVNGNYQCIQ